MPVKPDKKSSDGVGMYTFGTVGTIKSSAKYHFEAPRQGVYASTGAFLLWSDPLYSAAAADLQGFDRIWLIWVFNQNKHDSWRVKARVPVPAEQDCYSVFATRSPYRPNPIGISAVELLEICPDGLKLGACDLLDGTAVLDVKPYIPEVDSFPASRAGWRDRIDQHSWEITWSSAAWLQAEFILHNGGLDLMNFAHVQLKFRPTDRSRKRVEFDDSANCWVIHCRTWKLFFTLNEAADRVCVERIAGNYSAAELAPDAPDKYNDKALHRKFRQLFPAGEEY